MQTTISVAIPAYNAELWLGSALQSALAQTLPAHEIIVVDDGSKDRTEEVARSFGDKVRYIRQPNQGVSAARNTAIREATGNWIAFLDSDDLFLPEKIEKQSEIIETTPDLVVVYSAFSYLYADGGTLSVPVFPDEKLWPALRYRTPILPSTSVVRRSALEAVGGFTFGSKYGEDWQLWIRLIRRYGVAAFFGMSENLVQYRCWDNNATKNVLPMAQATLDMLNTILLDDLSGVDRTIWKRKIESRMYYHLALNLREANSDCYWQYAIESFLKWPLCGSVVPLKRYHVLAHMLYTRLRNFRMSTEYWWPERHCIRGMAHDKKPGHGDAKSGE